MKKKCNEPESGVSRFKKIVLVMRLTFFLMILTVLSSSAGSFGQRSKLDLNFKDRQIRDVLSQIEDQSEYSFMYDNNQVDVSKQVSLDVKSSTIESILDEIFKGSGVTYKVIDRHIMLFPTETVIQQQKSVTGKVTSAAGEPIPGASVAVKGTTNGTITNFDGNFTILNVPSNATLVFSFVGMKSKEVNVDNMSIVNVVLEEETIGIEEVVAIGYQTVRKKDLTGATAVVAPDAASKISSSSLSESIQGLAPGVTVRNGGAPGQASVIEIRGVASFVNSNPLYIIDGMIADANPTINTNDIETIQILKDASAAAIYGSRAANGVIIITTKKGKEGPTNISFSAKYGIQQVPKHWDVMDSAEFAKMKKQAYTNSNLPPMASIAGAYDASINTDWQDEVMRTGSKEDYNLSISGATPNMSYLVSGSHYRDKGSLEGYSFERSSLRINTDSKKGILKFGENLLLTYSTENSPADGNPFLDMPSMLPVIAVKNDKYIDTVNNNPWGWGIGSDDAITYAWNPIAVNDLYHRNSSYAKVVGNAFAELKLTNWLKYRFNAGLEASFDFHKTVRKQGKWGYNRPFESSFINEERSTYSSILFEHTLSFDKTLGDHQINGVVGYSWQQSKREMTSAGRTQLQYFGDSYMTTINSATGDPSAYGSIPTFYRLHGYLGRVNYSYQDKYLLTLTGRYDQDSRFGKDYRSGFFPSVAGAWRISKEDFYNISWMEDLKLHASYGQMGIVTVGSWDYIGFLNSNPRAIFGTGQVPTVGATQAKLANPDLTWETRIIKNIGVDAGLFENSLSIGLEAYDSYSKDALLNLPIAWYLGNLGGNPAVNAASIRNYGVEMSATYRNKKHELKWDVSANLTTIKNKVEDVGNQGENPEGESINFIQTGISRSQVGRSIGEWYVRKATGIFQSQNEINSYKSSDGKVIQPLAKPGDIRYADVNDDGVINGNDRTFCGSPWPTLQGGAQFNASYRHFTLNVQLVGVFGNKILNGVKQVLDGYQNTNFRKDVNPWTPTNTNTDDPRIGIAINDPGLADNLILESSHWLENGSYVRLRNVELGYNLPQNLIGKINVRNARVFISGQNLFVLTKYSGLDPDVVGNGILERGYDVGNWPSNRVISMGIQCEF